MQFRSYSTARRSNSHVQALSQRPLNIHKQSMYTQLLHSSMYYNTILTQSNNSDKHYT